MPADFCPEPNPNHPPNHPSNVVTPTPEPSILPSCEGGHPTILLHQCRLKTMCLLQLRAPTATMMTMMTMMTSEWLRGLFLPSNQLKLEPCCRQLSLFAQFQPNHRVRLRCPDRLLNPQPKPVLGRRLLLRQFLPSNHPRNKTRTYALSLATTSDLVEMLCSFGETWRPPFRLTRTKLGRWSHSCL